MAEYIICRFLLISKKQLKHGTGGQTMYDDLVKRLRMRARLFKQINQMENCIMDEAADAIEELSAIREEQKAQIIAMAAEDKPRWIPVTERLPREMETVLVTDGKNVGWSFCVNDYGTMEFYSAWTITHWMPLPEPPKEET